MQPGAKFEEHCSNISRDILDLAVKCISETIYDDTAFLICLIQKRQYLYNEKSYSKKEMPFFFILKSLSNTGKRQLFFTS